MPYEYVKNAQGEYVCPHCGATERNQSTMHYHLKRHEARLPHVCPHCRKEFLQRGSLAVHLQARHTSRPAAKAYSCPCCEQTCSSKDACAVHFLRKHCRDAVATLLEKAAVVAEDSYCCQACNKLSNSSKAFLSHLAASTTCLVLSDPTLQSHLTTIRTFTLKPSPKPQEAV